MIAEHITALENRIRDGAYFTVTGGCFAGKHGTPIPNAGIPEAFASLKEHPHTWDFELKIEMAGVKSQIPSYWISYNPARGTRIMKAPYTGFGKLHKIKTSPRFRPVSEYVLEAIQWIWENELMTIPEVARLRAHDENVVKILKTLSGVEMDSYFSTIPRDIARYVIYPRLADHPTV